MDVTETTEGRTVVVAPAGRLDSNTADDFERRLGAVLDAAPAAVLIDLARLDYLSSAGLRVLLMAAKRVRGHNTRLALCGMRPNVREIFEISGLTRLFDIKPSREAALLG